MRINRRSRASTVTGSSAGNQTVQDLHRRLRGRDLRRVDPHRESQDRPSVASDLPRASLVRLVDPVELAHLRPRALLVLDPLFVGHHGQHEPPPFGALAQLDQIEPVAFRVEVVQVGQDLVPGEQVSVRPDRAPEKLLRGLDRRRGGRGEGKEQDQAVDAQHGDLRGRKRQIRDGAHGAGPGTRPARIPEETISHPRTSLLERRPGFG